MAGAGSFLAPDSVLVSSTHYTANMEQFLAQIEQPFFCEACAHSEASAPEFMLHLLTEKHRAKVDLATTRSGDSTEVLPPKWLVCKTCNWPTGTDSPFPPFHCVLCDVTDHGVTQFSMHISTSKHFAMQEEWRRIRRQEATIGKRKEEYEEQRMKRHNIAFEF